MDTSIVSFIFNRDIRADYYKERIRGRRCVISFQTLEELRFGSLKQGWGEKRKNELELHLQQYAVVWANSEIAAISAYVRSEREKAGHPLSTSDAWIAATALMLNGALATHDRDFSGISGLKLITSLAR